MAATRDARRGKARRKSPATRQRGGTSARANSQRWSQRVTRESNALDLEPGVFSKRSAREVARSLKRSADRSRRRKADPYRSALSMLTFYINRAGRKLPASRKRTLLLAKRELRALYAGRTESGAHRQ
jgi:hypothetical protein